VDPLAVYILHSCQTVSVSCAFYGNMASLSLYERIAEFADAMAFFMYALNASRVHMLEAPKTYGSISYYTINV
jgi:hypothetical protein